MYIYIYIYIYKHIVTYTSLIPSVVPIAVSFTRIDTPNCTSPDKIPILNFVRPSLVTTEESLVNPIFKTKKYNKCRYWISEQFINLPSKHYGLIYNQWEKWLWAKLGPLSQGCYKHLYFTESSFNSCGQVRVFVEQLIYWAINEYTLMFTYSWLKQSNYWRSLWPGFMIFQ